MKDYSRENKQLVTGIERLLPPLLTYLVRKLVLVLIRANMFLLRLVGNRFGFNLSMEVSDRESWNWKVREKIPRYHAQVERKK